MFKLIKKFFTPPVFKDNEEKSQTAAYLNIIILAIFFGSIITAVINASISILILHTSPDALVMALLGGTGLFFLILYILLRLGYIRSISIVIPTTLWLAFTVPAYTFDGIRDNAIFGYFVVILIAGLVSETFILISFDALSILSVITIFLAETNGIITTTFGTPPPLSDVIIISVLLLISGFLLSAVVGRLSTSYAQAKQSTKDLEESNQELKIAQEILEEQAGKLARRSQYQQASAEVMREAVSTLKTTSLLPKLAELINTQFNLYRMGIFLVDTTGEWIVLSAASGEDIPEELISSFRLKVGSKSIVGYVAEVGQPYITHDVKEDPLFIDDPSTSDVRSEIALPLRIRENTIGVLDVQSREVAAFDDEDISILQTLADQVAIAINNARLFEQQLSTALESARLFQDTQRRAAREQLTGQITDKVHSSPGVEKIIQTALDELHKALGTSHAYVRLGNAPTQDEVQQGDGTPPAGDISPSGEEDTSPVKDASSGTSAEKSDPAKIDDLKDESGASNDG
ncbi:MAG: hypothetical protein B6I38_08520 [Anaerolineaceae bacterium 4572_5.1]|nr:MAG: hypothetical protein B6I38_08520 [Anaerolineaceae bacterium 4572_5.1]